MKKTAIYALLLTFMLSCENDDNDADCTGTPSGSGACPAVIDPVCGCDGKTYENSCYAEYAGVKKWTAGTCP